MLSRLHHLNFTFERDLQSYFLKYSSKYNNRNILVFSNICTVFLQCFRKVADSPQEDIRTEPLMKLTIFFFQLLSQFLVTRSLYKPT